MSGLTSLKRKSRTKVSEYKFCPMYFFSQKFVGQNVLKQ